MTPPPTPTNGSSTACSPPHASASAGAATGSISPASPSRSLSADSSLITPGAYRDYVIDNFNADRPYNQFLREQIAGDLLSSHDLAERRRQLVATTFLTLGNTNLEDQDKHQLDMDVVDEQIDTLGKAFLAQTIACARCHDHKFDPIPTADYYALAGILANVRTLEHANVSHWLERPMPLPPDQEQALAAARNPARLPGSPRQVRACPPQEPGFPRGHRTGKVARPCRRRHESPQGRRLEDLTVHRHLHRRRLPPRRERRQGSQEPHLRAREPRTGSI